MPNSRLDPDLPPSRCTWKGELPCPMCESGCPYVDVPYVNDPDGFYAESFGASDLPMDVPEMESDGPPAPATPAIGLSLEQRAVVDHMTAPALVTAGAGSGKTRSICERVQAMVQKHEVLPSTIVVVTFTRKAATELRMRLGRALGFRVAKQLVVSTFHGLALGILRERAVYVNRKPNFSVFDDQTCRAELRRILKEIWKPEEATELDDPRGPVFEGERLGDPPKADEVYDFIGEQKEKGLEIDEAFYAAANLKWGRLGGRVVVEYELAKQNANAVDFEDLVWMAWRALRDDETLAAAYHARWRTFIVDEYQDTNDLQERFIKALVGPERNLMVVGDEDQCQPDDTAVLLPDGTEKLLRDMKRGDCVQSYARHEKALIRSRIVNEVHHRRYSGPIIHVKTDSKSSRSTPNHKWLIRWLPRAERAEMSLWCTYLMRKGDSFRIGKTSLFRSSGIGSEKRIIGLVLRVRQESADHGWILKVYNSDMDATIDEQVLSATYGIPEACFKAIKSSKNFTQEVLDIIHASIPNQVERATACLVAHGRLIEYPLIDARAKQTRRTVEEIHACNLMSGVMSIPKVESFKDSRGKTFAAEWSPLISVTTSHYDGVVTSLDVDRDHKYVADGLVTCNSIYAFRGANVEHILGFLERWPGAVRYPLGCNYRSTKNIVSAAARLIEHNQNRFAKEIWTENAQGWDVEVHRHRTVKDEADRILSMVMGSLDAGYPIQEHAILVRMRRQLPILEAAFVTANIPLMVIGATPYWERADVKRILSWLRAVENPSDYVSGAYAFGNWPAIGATTVRAWLDYAERGDRPMWLYLPLLFNQKGMGKATKKGQSMQRFLERMDALSEYVRSEWTLRDIILWLYDVTGLDEEIAAALNGMGTVAEEGRERTRLRADLIASAPEKTGFMVVREYLDSILQAATRRADEGRVTLITAHSAKGAEWDHVFIAGMVDGIYPSRRFSADMGGFEEIDPKALEEERRLMYVAFTRARMRLVLNYPEMIEVQGRTTWGRPSRFLFESGAMAEPVRTPRTAS